MRTPIKGEIYWLCPQDSKRLNQLGLIIEEGDDKSLFAMCNPDIHLAGHLDPIFMPEETGIPFTIAVFTHIAQWVPHSMVGEDPISTLSSSMSDAVDLARNGEQTAGLKYGFPLANPILEPRWSLIEMTAHNFMSSFNYTEKEVA